MILPELVRDLAIIVRGTLAYRFLTERVSPTNGKEMIETAGAFLVLGDDDGHRLFAWIQALGDDEKSRARARESRQ